MSIYIVYPNLLQSAPICSQLLSQEAALVDSQSVADRHIRRARRRGRIRRIIRRCPAQGEDRDLAEKDMAATMGLWEHLWEICGKSMENLWNIYAKSMVLDRSMANLWVLDDID